MKKAETSEGKVKKSLRYSVLDGTGYSAMVGFGESFISAFAVFLKATNTQLALLGSLPQAIGSFSQLASGRAIKFFGNRKKTVVTGAMLQALMYIPILLVFFAGNFGVDLLILFVCMYWVFGAILGPAWTSWMGDLVDERKRGSYFGRRNKIAGMASFFSMLIAGFMLHQNTDGILGQYVGFVSIFLIALGARIASATFLSKQYEPHYNTDQKTQMGFIDFVRKARSMNYGLFTFYLLAMNFSVYLAAPFFAGYMLYDLKFDYFAFTIINATALIAKFVAMPVWGRAADRFGTRKVLSLSGFLMPLTPILWLVSSDFVYLTAVQVYSGFFWAGFEISSFNFIFDTTTPEKRTSWVAYMNVLNGVAILFGGIAGGIAVNNNVFWSKYLYVFMLSGVLRYAASLIFIPKLREVRQVEHIPYSKLLFNVITTTPTMGLFYKLVSMKIGGNPWSVKPAKTAAGQSYHEIKEGAARNEQKLKLVVDGKLIGDDAVDKEST